tara:strand:- start:61 stop:597 length:537 start_codon:yes stop_codon:yes gene_type:complete
LLVAAAATFKHKGGVEGLVGKFAARAGAQCGALLVDFASGLEALVSVQPMRCRRRGRARGDLAPGDLVPGPVKHFWLEEQGPVGAAVFRLRVLERSRDRLIVDIRNQRAANPPVHPKISAGGYRYLFMFERHAPGVWRYYGLTGLRGKGGCGGYLVPQLLCQSRGGGVSLYCRRPDGA